MLDDLHGWLVDYFLTWQVLSSTWTREILEINKTLKNHSEYTNHHIHIVFFSQLGSHTIINPASNRHEGDSNLPKPWSFTLSETTTSRATFPALSDLHGQTYNKVTGYGARSLVDQERHAKPPTGWLKWVSTKRRRRPRERALVGSDINVTINQSINQKFISSEGSQGCPDGSILPISLMNLSHRRAAEHFLFSSQLKPVKSTIWMTMGMGLDQKCWVN